MVNNVKTELFCLNCDQDTIHEITYIGNYLKSIRCVECGRTIKVDRQHLIKEFTADALERLITKPHRISEELRSDFQHCLRTLPSRIITKPFRTMREIKEILHKQNNTG